MLEILHCQFYFDVIYFDLIGNTISSARIVHFSSVFHSGAEREQGAGFRVRVQGSDCPGPRARANIMTSSGPASISLSPGPLTAFSCLSYLLLTKC